MPRSSQKKKGSEDRSKVYELLFGARSGTFQKKEEKPKEHWYVDFCKLSSKYFGAQAKKEITDDYQRALSFLGWKLKPEELNSAPLFAMYVGGGLAALYAVLNYIFWLLVPAIPSSDFALVGRGGIILGHPLAMGLDLLFYLGPFALALYFIYFIQSVPLKEVEKEKIRALAFIPEIVNYLVMAMKVTPNLERAITFSASHGHGHISEDFKAMQYDIHIGKYKTVEEALDNLAWKWGKYSEEFKHALMLVRSSVMEGDETKRNALLDKAVQDVLEGIQEKMDFYSRQMHSPSIYLYYFGVLLPLLLIIIIPVGAMMGGESIGFLASPWVLMLVYNIIIPAVTLVMANGILEKRPPTRAVPEVPLDLPGLPKPGWFSLQNYQLPVLVVCGIIFVATVVGITLASSVLDPRPQGFDPAFKTYCIVHLVTPPAGVSLAADATPVDVLDAGGAEVLCIPILVYASFFLGIVYAVAFYLWAYHKDRRRTQLELVDMENQFQDTLYVLASRLGEGRPMEEALKHAAEFMPESLATKKIFIPTLQNIVMMGMTLQTALFDKAYGSLRYIPSPFISGTMRIVVDSLSLGVQTAARSLVSLSLQLRDSQKVEKALKAMLEDITNMLSTMSIFIAPVVLGITIALQRIIMNALKSMSQSTLGGGAGQTLPGMTAFQMPTLGSAEALAGAASQAQLLFIITMYMIEIVVVLIYFASNVNEGKNDLAFRMALAQALPIAMTVFFVVVFGAMKVTAISI